MKVEIPTINKLALFEDTIQWHCGKCRIQVFGIKGQETLSVSQI